MLPLLLALYGGPNAKTADYEKLITAKTMEMDGRTKQEIWDKTGWFRSPQGTWQFEIDDSKAKYKGAGGKTLGDVMDHPEYYQAYPEAAKRPIQINETRSGQSSGLYDPTTRSMNITGQPQDILRTIIHETTHDNQREEGGPNYQKGFERYQYNPKELNQLFNPQSTEPRIYNELMQRHQNNPFEMDARSASDRTDFTPELRKKFPPWTVY